MPTKTLYIELVRERPHGPWDDREGERELRNGFLLGSRLISGEQAIDLTRRAQDAGEEIVIVESCDLATEILHDFRMHAEIVAGRVESATSAQHGDRVLQCMIDCWKPAVADGEKPRPTLDWRITLVESESAITAALIEENGGPSYYPDDESDQT